LGNNIKIISNVIGSGGGGGEILLTVPVLTNGKLGQAIREVKIDCTQKFIKKHLLTIQMNYSRSSTVKRLRLYFPRVKKTYESSPQFLIN